MAPLHAFERLPEDWARFLPEEPAYRARQLFSWLHGRGVTDIQKMSDLPRTLRTSLEGVELRPNLDLTRRLDAADGTRKLALRTSDGRDLETVLIPQANAGPAEPLGLGPWTQCVSSQIGCAMGCVFCASGVAGLKRNLTASEIVAQVAFARAMLGSAGPIRRIVFMGMGEPLHNYEAVSRAIRILSHPLGLGLSLRRLTLSTSGLVPQIDQLGADFRGKIPLALSLHAPDDELRSKLVPINRKYPLAKVMAALRRYPLPKRARFTIEYTLIRDLNDAPAQAHAVARLLGSLPVKVNVIPMNPVEETPFRPPTAEGLETFQQILRSHGFSVFVRTKRGGDIDAACGQLALHGEPRKVRTLQMLASSPIDAG